MLLALPSLRLQEQGDSLDQLSKAKGTGEGSSLFPRLGCTVGAEPVQSPEVGPRRVSPFRINSLPRSQWWTKPISLGCFLGAILAQFSF